MKYIRLLMITVLCWSGVVNGAISELEFADNTQRERYMVLMKELRCLVCQNQSLADSDAGLAQDLRKEVYNMLQQGKSDQEIAGFLVARYGDFVLYSPPVKPTTAVLWAGPFVLLLVGLVVLVYSIKRRKHSTQTVELTPEEQERLARLDTTDDEGRA